MNERQNMDCPTRHMVTNTKAAKHCARKETCACSNVLPPITAGGRNRDGGTGSTRKKKTEYPLAAAASLATDGGSEDSPGEGVAVNLTGRWAQCANTSMRVAFTMVLKSGNVKL